MTDIEIPVNPDLPAEFDDTANEERPESHQEWWFRPYVVSSGDGWAVRCLDGGAWDRSTWHGSYPDLGAALQAAQALADRYRPYRSMELSAALLNLWHRGAQVAEIVDGEIRTRPMTIEDVPFLAEFLATKKGT